MTLLLSKAGYDQRIRHERILNLIDQAYTDRDLATKHLEEMLVDIIEVTTNYIELVKSGDRKQL